MRTEPDRRRLQRHQSKENETQQAQSTAQQQAQSRGPLVDLHDGDAAELIDRLTEPGVESDQYEDLEEMLAPYLPHMQMLASHDDGEYYDDLSHELLNENLADRLIRSRERGRLLTGPFLDVARDVEHEQGTFKSRPLAPREKQAMRAAIEDVRTDRQSLGDGTFLSAVTEMHVSSEVRRDDNVDESDGGGGLLSALKPW
jgi:hypothetical protein